ncbi:MAG TPA: aminotransferase class IV, partial [Bradyrhizobium sp.]|nr:aminotransferase class IV [Bradyrhizobium sp.]
RRTAIELCQRLNIPLRVEPLPAADVRDADEVFLTSTGGGILPIARIDGRPVRQFPGPVTQRLRDAYWAMREEPAYRDAVDYR